MINDHLSSVLEFISWRCGPDELVMVRAVDGTPGGAWGNVESFREALGGDVLGRTQPCAAADPCDLDGDSWQVFVRSPYDVNPYLLIRLRDGEVLWEDTGVETFRGTARLCASAFYGWKWALDPEKGILPRVGDRELEILSGFEQGPESKPQGDLFDRFVHVVGLNPSAVAVIQGDRETTYGDLIAMSGRVATQLAAAGVGAGDRVAVSLPRDEFLYAVYLALWSLGAAYVPVAVQHGHRFLESCVQNAEASHVVEQSTGSAEMAWRVRASGYNPVTREGVAYVMSTSGSSGKPKMVSIPPHAIARLVIDSTVLPLTESDRMFTMSSVSFDAATWEVWGALLNGAALVLPLDEDVPDPDEVCQLIARHGVTASFFTVTYFDLLLKARPELLSKMRHLVVGGEAVPPRLIEAAVKTVPGNALVNGYGPTENTTFSCVYRLGLRSLTAAATTPIGKPIDGTNVYVLGVNRDRVPIGCVGEIAVGGSGLAEGYWGDQMLSKQKFVEAKSVNEARVYLTGDLGRWLPSGDIEYLGRGDRQVKSRGYRIELTGVEAAIAAHEDVDRVTVTTRERGHAKELVAIVLSARGVGKEQLKQHSAGLLPPFALPDVWVILDTLPATANGKLDVRAVLQENESAEAPLLPAVSKIRTVAGAGDSLRAKVNEVWATALDIDNLDPNARLWDIGANSLTALTVAQQLSQKLGRRVAVRTVLQAPSVQALVNSLSGKNTTSPQQLLAKRRARGHERRSSDV